MSYVKGLRCRECAAESPIAPLHVCETCFGPLEVVYDYPAIRRALTREVIAARPRNLWRYRELLPVEAQETVSKPNSIAFEIATETTRSLYENVG